MMLMMRVMMQEEFQQVLIFIYYHYTSALVHYEWKAEAAKAAAAAVPAMPVLQQAPCLLSNFIPETFCFRVRNIHIHMHIFIDDDPSFCFVLFCFSSDEGRSSFPSTCSGTVLYSKPPSLHYVHSKLQTHYAQFGRKIPTSSFSRLYPIRPKIYNLFNYHFAVTPYPIEPENSNPFHFRHILRFYVTFGQTELAVGLYYLIRPKNSNPLNFSTPD
jgi:hypothetical protein